MQRPAGEITRECDVVQTFTASAGCLAGVAPLMANYASKRTGHIALSLYRIADARLLSDGVSLVARLARPGPDPALELVARFDEQAEAIADNSPLDLFCPPVVNSAGQSFALRIHSDDAVPGNALTVWLSSGSDRIANHVRCFVGGADQGDYGIAARLGFAPPTASEVPEVLVYSPVTQCNLNCVHCISRETRAGVFRVPQSIKERIRHWCARGLVKAIFTDYSGDILWADARFGGELDFLMDLDVPFHINTNGTHLTKDVSAKLMRSRVVTINVSLDAARDETFRRIRRGAPPLEEVLDKIRALVAIRAAAGAVERVQLGMAYVLMRSNLDEWKDFIRLAGEIGVETVWTRHLEAYTADMEEESLWFDRERFNQARIEAMEVAREVGVVMAVANPFEDLLPRRGHGYCSAPWDAAMILGNGDVMACCVPRTKMGNLLEQNLEDIWNGPLYRAFRAAVNSPEPPPMCADCPIFRRPNNRDSYLVHRVMKDWRSPYDCTMPAVERRVGHRESTPAARVIR
jgi:radical SAM protein with 4Fe4S-binding SPASM domain